MVNRVRLISPRLWRPHLKGVKEGYEQAFLRGGWGDIQNIKTLTEPYWESSTKWLLRKA